MRVKCVYKCVRQWYDLIDTNDEEKNTNATRLSIPSISKDPRDQRGKNKRQTILSTLRAVQIVNLCNGFWGGEKIWNKQKEIKKIKERYEKPVSKGGLGGGGRTLYRGGDHSIMAYDDDDDEPGISSVCTYALTESTESRTRRKYNAKRLVSAQL